MCDVTKLNNIHFYLSVFNKRIVFDIIYQDPNTIPDDRDIFIASNGYSVIICKRMDVQTERLWLRGTKEVNGSTRSGTMVFSSNEDRNIAYNRFMEALREWDEYATEKLLDE